MSSCSDWDMGYKHQETNNFRTREFEYVETYCTYLLIIWTSTKIPGGGVLKFEMGEASGQY